ncbi:MAG: formate dehydrogenase accessory sulfurtransferase FdhD [Candidatus Thalassarchaeaceae archaeon]|jgi:FdhD protein|nr:formate dehydrogenase accessory sulfurtransferase FdhD [Candidatus Thalassarchaeaceae archaeon]MDP6844493.1 formate dehydrogenase accessory sulfurtransferase FdhD [Candidatus Thalassarchaeaceae archaeon]
MEERVAAQRVVDGETYPLEESVAVEEPLEIQINGQPWITTMRTPGHDRELALGLLYSEGLLSDLTEIDQIHVEDNVILIGGDISIEGHSRGFVRSSSCGVCGRASLDAILARHPPAISSEGFSISSDSLDSLLTQMRTKQSVFDTTGGVHAVALFSEMSDITELAEDVGRHNAMDKVIGRTLTQLPLSNLGFLLSGRVSFEMVQKAVMVGSPCIVAIGAPTTLAVDLARQHGLTLIGFLRDGRFNVYCGANRIRNE